MYRFELKSKLYPEDNVTLEFSDKDNDIDIYELHRLCKAFAAALGYHPNSIEDAFGPTQYSD